MTKQTNIELLNEIVQEAQDIKAVIPKIESMADVDSLHNRLSTYPSNKNAFYEALTNKIAKTVVDNRVFKNPLAELSKGQLMFGEGIEQIHCEFLKSKNYQSGNFGNNKSSVEDLINGLPPKLRVDYITKNFDREYCTSISDSELRKALYKETGISDLTNAIINRLESSAQRDMYNDIKSALTQKTSDTDWTSNGTKFDKGLITLAEESENKANIFVELTQGSEMDLKELAQLIRENTAQLTFPNGVCSLTPELESFTQTEDMVYITTPKYQSLIETHVLASAFNIEKTEVSSKTLLIDDLGTTKGTGATDDANVLGILCDKNLLQYWTINNTMSTFVNPERKNQTNFFKFLEGVSGINPFAQFKIFIHKTV